VTGEKIRTACAGILVVACILGIIGIATKNSSYLIIGYFIFLINTMLMFFSETVDYENGKLKDKNAR